MRILAHAGGDEGLMFGSALFLLMLVGGGMALLLVGERSGGLDRRIKTWFTIAALVTAAALAWIPVRYQTCHAWRDQLLNATSVLVSASGAGSDTPPAMSAQDRATVQSRVRQILGQRPFGCI
ncbi:MAG TPA: hypothetical protein VKG45_15630 [Actinomycetes bacterium]|nr:hypothetical protein [Actinomycetes bacterium]